MLSIHRADNQLAFIESDFEVAKHLPRFGSRTLRQSAVLEVPAPDDVEPIQRLSLDVQAVGFKATAEPTGFLEAART